MHTVNVLNRRPQPSYFLFLARSRARNARTLQPAKLTLTAPASPECTKGPFPRDHLRAQKTDLQFSSQLRRSAPMASWAAPFLMYARPWQATSGVGSCEPPPPNHAAAARGMHAQTTTPLSLNFLFCLRIAISGLGSAIIDLQFLSSVGKVGNNALNIFPLPCILRTLPAYASLMWCGVVLVVVETHRYTCCSTEATILTAGPPRTYCALHQLHRSSLNRQSQNSHCSNWFRKPHRSLIIHESIASSAAIDKFKSGVSLVFAIDGLRSTSTCPFGGRSGIAASLYRGHLKFC
jgi:hypothetical protein